MGCDDVAAGQALGASSADVILALDLQHAGSRQAGDIRHRAEAEDDPWEQIRGSETCPLFGSADGRERKSATQKEEEEKAADKGRHRDPQGRRTQTEIVEPGVLAERGDYAERYANKDGKDNGDKAQLQRDRELSRNQFLNRFSPFRGVRRTEIETEDAGHVVEESAVNERRSKCKRIPDSLRERLIDRLGIDPERLVETKLGIERLDGRGRKCLLAVPRSPRSAVHEKEGDGRHRDYHRDDPEHSAKGVFQHY